ncbi:hypothetical protein JCM17960_09770 [Magnetospira thiophila]
MGAAFTMPEAAARQAGPCPECGGAGPVYAVRTKSDRGWWKEWVGCESCIAPLAWASEAQDETGQYGIALMAKRRR